MMEDIARHLLCMQNDPELLTRTEAEVTQLKDEMDKLKLQTEARACNGSS